MPELPEVEVVRMGLEKVLVNKTFLEVEIREKKIIAGNGTKRKADIKKEREFVNGVLNKKGYSKWIFKSCVLFGNCFQLNSMTSPLCKEF